MCTNSCLKSKEIKNKHDCHIIIVISRSLPLQPLAPEARAPSALLDAPLAGAIQAHLARGKNIENMEGGGPQVEPQLKKLILPLDCRLDFTQTNICLTIMYN